jgi:Holliday junction resolvase
MVMTPEKKVKVKVVAMLKAAGVYWFYPVMGGYGSSGVPDIVGCCNGRFFAVECKSGGNKPTALQLKNLAQIQESGGYTLVVNEQNLDSVGELLAFLEKENPNGFHA